ncbi:MAG: acetolactate synthase small subunit [Bacteroidales bacterium]|nr:acetolactate synthase small subunit [Bacteroidales bacterium]
MEMEKDTMYTVTVYSENQVGLLSAISSIFTRRSLNIWSLTVSASSTPGVHKFTIASETTEDRISAVVKQIERRVDVIKAFYYKNDEIVYREIALYKVETAPLLESNALESLISKHHARIIEMNNNFTVLQKTGHCEDTLELYNDLKNMGKVLQFVRSGRVAVTKSDHEFVDEFLAEREEERKRILGE